MGQYIVVLIIVFVVFFLYKKGVIQNVNFPRIEFGCLFNHGLTKVDMSYRLYNGINKYPFVIKKNKEMTLKYSVSVERGSLTVKFVDGNTIVFDKTFTSNERGEFVFTPFTSTQFITIIGNFTKGKCDFEYIEAVQAAETSN